MKIPPYGSRAIWLERANGFFEEVRRAVPQVVSAAEQKSRAQLPEYWRAQDEAGQVGERLSVRGIWIDPTIGSADYVVGCNYAFIREDSIHVPELPDGHCILVSRDRNGGLLAVG